MALNRGFLYRWRVPPDSAGARLRDHLVTAFPQAADGEWAARLARGDVHLDEVCARGDERLAAGQTLTWARPPWDEPAVPDDIAVIHEDGHLLVVAKPAGLPTMPAGGYLEHTLLAMVRARFGPVHPAHRLGRGTSGLVAFARSREAAAALTAAFRTRTAHKVYRALVAGDPPWNERHVTMPIGPVPHPRLGTVHAAHVSGRPAESAATVIERRGDTTLCAVTIATGRPHQIRIHLAAAGHPLVGDPLYGSGGQPMSDALPGDGGYLLHAHRLTVPHPATAAPFMAEAPPPVALQTTHESGR